MSADRPLEILEYLSMHADGATLREIRDGLDLPRSSAWLLVRQLEESGFVDKAGPNRFVPGARLVRMGLMLYQTAAMAGDGRMILQDLSNATGMDVYLAIRTGDSVVYADRIFGANSIQIRRPLGEPRSLHASAPGKIFLAYDDGGLWERAIAGRTLERLTPHTVTNHKELRAQLQKARAVGYVEAHSEVLMSISSLASMVFEPDGQPWAAVVLSAHESDFSPQREELIAKLLKATRKLTEVRRTLAADRVAGSVLAMQARPSGRGPRRSAVQR